MIKLPFWLNWCRFRSKGFVPTISRAQSRRNGAGCSWAFTSSGYRTEHSVARTFNKYSREADPHNAARFRSESSND